MARRGGRDAKKARISSAGADRITALPLELRAHIVSYLPYAEAARVSALSRPWRGVHRHTAVVKVNLDDFLYLDDYVFDKADDALPGILDDGALHGLRVDLSRRAREGSTVDMAVDNKSVWDGDLGRMIPEETITCNLRGLMASLDV